MGDDQSDGNRSEYDVESLRVVKEEARDALDHQIDALNDKAAKTLRLNVLFLGVVLTAASILASSNATPTIERLTTPLVIAGITVSAVSMLTSIWAYTSRSYQTGTGPSDVRTFSGFV